MSTKTTLKRIALVAVSALGVGMLAATPSGAVQPSNWYNSSMSISTTSLTVVGSGTTDANSGKFYVDLTSTGTLADKYPGLRDDESLTVTVTGVPTATTAGAAASDLNIQPIRLSSNTADSGFTNVGNASSSGYVRIPDGALYDSYDSNNWTPDANDTSGYENRYWFAVYPASGKAVDYGTYTIRVRLFNGDSNGVQLIDQTISVTFVSSIANAGATLSLSKSGDIYNGEGLSYATGRYVKATLAGATAGSRVVMGTDHEAALSGQAVDLNSNFVNAAGTVGSALYEYDNGVAGEDHIAPSNASISTNSTYTALRSIADGVYGITSIATTGATATDISQTAAADTVIRVRVTSTTVSQTLAVIIRSETTARDIYTDLTLTATGAVGYSSSSETIANATAADVTRNNVESSTTYVLPLTTTSATLTVNLDSADNTPVTSGVVVLVTPTWSNSYVSSAVTPATSTTGTSYTTDAAGNISIPVTNSSPIDTGTLTLSITGFASGSGTVGTGSRTVVLTWQKPAVTTMSVLDPVDGVYVKTGTTNTFTVGVYDQFGNGMANEVLQPAITDSGAAQYVLNKTYSTITTGSAGTATWSLTDALAANEDYDTVVFTSITDRTKSASGTVTYVTTLPAVSTVTLYYDADRADTANSLVPASGMGTYLIQKARNQSRSLAAFSDTNTDDILSMRARVLTSASLAAEGAACTVSASAGAHLLNASGLPTSSRTFAVNSSGDVTWTTLATTIGVKTYTITCGSVSAKATFTAGNATADARFITISGGATGTANGEGVPVTVSVTDRFGNGVKDVVLTLSASGAGAFSGGATTQSFTTSQSGTYTFLATSFAEAGGAATFTVSTSSTTEFASVAGKSSTTVIDSDVKAGNSSATHSMTFAAGRNAATVAAEAATDAAAEAIDAANAATDAANLAAEAADAATVAAEEARDAADAATAAVEELATQVATLMAALKAQITTLANTVAKIAKKVKA